MIDPKYPFLRPYAMVLDDKGLLKEVISWPFPETDYTAVMVREKDDPATMVKVRADSLQLEKLAVLTQEEAMKLAKRTTEMLVHYRRRGNHERADLEYLAGEFMRIDKEARGSDMTWQRK